MPITDLFLLLSKLNFQYVGELPPHIHKALPYILGLMTIGAPLLLAIEYFSNKEIEDLKEGKIAAFELLFKIVTLSFVMLCGYAVLIAHYANT